uniref:Uncharacterized protein n=1 Tax=Rhinolophus ferrumequinum TaxID=59479 RepID=A0A671ENG3_RHIFE
MEEITNFKIPTKLSEKKKSALCSTPCCRYSCLSVYAEAWLCLRGKCLPYEMISKREYGPKKGAPWVFPNIRLRLVLLSWLSTDLLDFAFIY